MGDDSKEFAVEEETKAPEKAIQKLRRIPSLKELEERYA